MGNLMVHVTLMPFTLSRMTVAILTALLISSISQMALHLGICVIAFIVARDPTTMCSITMIAMPAALEPWHLERGLAVRHQHPVSSLGTTYSTVAAVTVLA